MNKRSIWLSICMLAASCAALSQDSHVYKIVKTFHILSPGGWDYLAINNNRLYVSHATQVNILDEGTGDSLGFIPNTMGVHGIAFIDASNKGYTSNGRSNNVTVFDLRTNRVLKQVSTGQNPDAILYEPFSKKIITCNGRGNDLSVIDPVNDTVINTIPVGGKPETAVSDEAGHLYVNIEDKSEIVVVNTKTFVVENRWSIAPGESPTGLAIDRTTKRLFAGCDNKLLIIIDATNGKVINKLPIGEGCDGVAFDSKIKTIYTSNGDGSMTVIKEKSPDEFGVVGNVTTKRGARTITVDEKSHTIFLPTADFEAANSQNGRPRTLPGTFQVLVIQ